MKILSFGQITEITGAPQWSLDNINSTDQLRQKLSDLFPALQHTTYLIAVNQQVIRENITLRETDIIALLPPFSGG